MPLGTRGRHSRWHRLLLTEGIVDFSVRGFRTDRQAARARLEKHARAYVRGFNAALCAEWKGSREREHLPEDLEALLTDIAPAERGFAWEGAGTACTLVDLFTLSRGRRLESLLTASAGRYAHLVHVGSGWAFSRFFLPRPVLVHGLDPLLKWLALDGAGFACAFFGGRSLRARQHTRHLMCNQKCRIRYQGLGRALWFIESADVEAIAQMIERFTPVHSGDLWSGVGLAAAYAGGATEEELGRLVELAEDYLPDVRQGTAFAAEAQRCAGHLPDSSAMAIRLLAGVKADEAAGWARSAERELSRRGPGSDAYLQWRARTRSLAMGCHRPPIASRQANLDMVRQ